jgi:hypothetical protein
MAKSRIPYERLSIDDAEQRAGDEAYIPTPKKSPSRRVLFVIIAVQTIALLGLAFHNRGGQKYSWPALVYCMPSFRSSWVSSQ